MGATGGSHYILTEKEGAHKQADRPIYFSLQRYRKKIHRTTQKIVLIISTLKLEDFINIL